jgi:1,4-dihydroxy-2-naphthoate octaprenyltransferase
VSVVSAPTMSPVRAWLLAARPATLPAAAVPVLVGAAAAVHEGVSFRPLVFAATLAAALLIQIGTNFANDYSDFHRGADHEGRLGPTRVTQSGLIEHAMVRRGIVVAFGTAALLGIYLAFVGGWPIVVIGVLSIICGLAYTGGPWPFGYHGLGDLFVFLFFGLVAVSGTAYLQAGSWSSFALALGVPIGLLVTNILVVNNLRDLDTDHAAGKRTLAVRLGERATRIQYTLFVVVAYLTLPLLSLSELVIPRSASVTTHLWLLLPLLSLPLAVSLVRTILSGVAGRELNPILKRSGQLLLLFGVLLALALLLSCTHS